MSLECAGFARDFAKVEDQVRFLTRTLEAIYDSLKDLRGPIADAL